MIRSTKQQSDYQLLLHNIRSVYNTGAIFRVADAAGISKIYISGYTPTPLDRFNRPRADFHKSALGAEKFVNWESIKNPARLIEKLKKSGYQIIGVEQDKKALDYRKIKPRTKALFVFGNEVRGLSPALKSLCDVLVEIPQRGKLARDRRPDYVGKESLNVSVAAGIVIFRIINP